MKDNTIAMEKAPIYSLVRDDDYFRIIQHTFTEIDYSTSYPSLLEIYQRWKSLLLPDTVHCQYKKSCISLFTAYLIIAAAEKEQRIVHRRLTDKNTLNITYHVERARNYLRTSIENAIRQEVYAEKRGTKLSPKEIDTVIKDRLAMASPNAKKFDDLINAAFKSIKDDMHYPATDPVDHSYKVTDKEIKSATTEPCKQYLETLKTREAIYPEELKAIEQELKSKYSANNEATDVIKTIKDTKSREHLAAYSITTEKDQTTVGIVNLHRQYIRMESWKFLALLEREGEALRLTELFKTKMGEPPPVFIFNENKEGIVVGKYDMQKSTIEVVCLKEEVSKSPEDRATFVVDSTYTLVIYAALKRLKEDAERFKRLREQAQTLVKINKDPFTY